MSVISRQYRLLFLCIGLAGILVAGFLLNRTYSILGGAIPSGERVDSAVDFTQAKDHWRARIEDIGGASAYEEMVSEGNNATASQAHVLAHSFGEALFRAEGVEGFTACGTQFLYGCYHQFIGNAVAALGLPVVERFRASCTSKPFLDTFPCLHGLGHGILGYLGYSLEDLKKALTLCKAPTPVKERSGCIDGVFMEYNIRGLTAYQSGKIEPRTFSVRSVYSPCLDVDKKYRTPCVFQLPDWWIAAIAGPGDIKGRFAQAGTYCTGINDDALRRTCFAGIGHITPPLSNLNSDTAVPLCAAAASRDYLAACLSAAAFRFKLEGFEDYLGLCQRFGLSGNDLTRCRKFENKSS